MIFSPAPWHKATSHRQRRVEIKVWSETRKSGVGGSSHSGWSGSAWLPFVSDVHDSNLHRDMDLCLSDTSTYEQPPAFKETKLAPIFLQGAYSLSKVDFLSSLQVKCKILWCLKNENYGRTKVEFSQLFSFPHYNAILVIVRYIAHVVMRAFAVTWAVSL